MTNPRRRWHYEAQIGSRISFGKYLGTYERAIEILFEEIESRHLPANAISYPLLFLVRHSLELGYKMNINYLAKYSELDEKVNWNRHYLIELHEAFRLHFMAVVSNLGVGQDIVDEFNRYCSEVEALTSTFNDIDRGSYSFRYPVDTDQNEVFHYDETINLLDVKELYDKAMTLLWHTADVLSDATDYHDYMERMIDQALYSSYNPY